MKSAVKFERSACVCSHMQLTGSSFVYFRPFIVWGETQNPEAKRTFAGATVDFFVSHRRVVYGRATRSFAEEEPVFSSRYRRHNRSLVFSLFSLIGSCLGTKAPLDPMITMPPAPCTTIPAPGALPTTPTINRSIDQGGSGDADQGLGSDAKGSLGDDRSALASRRLGGYS